MVFEVMSKEIKQNAFGDYLVSKNGVHKGHTLKILGAHKVFNKKVRIGYILKRDDGHVPYDNMGNAIERSEFGKLLLNFFK